MKVFVVSFGDGANSPVSRLVASGAPDDVETKDGGAAYKRISRMVPDLVVFDGDRRPGHVAQTLRAVLQLKKLQQSRFVVVAAHPSPQFMEFANDARLRIVSPEEAREVLPG